LLKFRNGKNLDNKLKKYECANQEKRHSNYWKTDKKGLVKANSKEERIDKWYCHFKKLLGKEAVTTGEHYVKQILQPQDIKEDAFTH